MTLNNNAKLVNEKYVIQWQLKWSNFAFSKSSMMQYLFTNDQKNVYSTQYFHLSFFNFIFTASRYMKFSILSVHFHCLACWFWTSNANIQSCSWIFDCCCDKFRLLSLSSHFSCFSCRLSILISNSCCSRCWLLFLSSNLYCFCW